MLKDNFTYDLSHKQIMFVDDEEYLYTEEIILEKILRGEYETYLEEI